MKLILPVLLLACVPAAASAATQAPVKATITMREPGALEVNYELPPDCPALQFRDEGTRPNDSVSLRRDWSVADDCTVLDGREIRRKQASCTNLRLRVPATTRGMDRVYPWAYPVENGLYVHTSSYVLLDTCGAVDWRFVVPGGTVVVDGVMAAESGARAAAAGSADEVPIVLLRQPFVPGAVSRVHASSSFAPQTLVYLNTTLHSIDAELRKELPGIRFTVPFVVASPSDNPHNYWGDVANRSVMRLSFPTAPGPEQEDLLHGFVAHEMAHLTQPRTRDDSWKEDEATVHEGGAEFLRVVMATRLGWLDHNGLTSELEKAVNDCLIATKGKSWKEIPNRGWGKNPYQCGLALHAIGLSSKPTQSALLRLRDYNRQGEQGKHTDFPQALECGAARNCRAEWLPRLAGAEPMEKVLLDYARQPGTLLRPAAEWPASMVGSIAFRHIAQLMAMDCKGAVSMYMEKTAARVAPGLSCGALREDMVIVSAEGLPLFEDGRAVKASAKACHETGKTMLGLRDGGSVSVSCNASVNPPGQLFEVDPARARALLK